MPICLLHGGYENEAAWRRGRRKCGAVLWVPGFVQHGNMTSNVLRLDEKRRKIFE
jgi:hypothetical protein